MVHPAMAGPAEPHRLGLSLLAVGLGAAIGWHYGGPLAGLAGAAFGGAAVNSYRAFKHYQEGSEEADKEAKVELTYAALGGGVGAYLLYKVGEKKKTHVQNPDESASDVDESDYHDNQDSEEDADGDDKPNPSCPIRKVGP